MTTKILFNDDATFDCVEVTEFANELRRLISFGYSLYTDYNTYTTYWSNKI